MNDGTFRFSPDGLTYLSSTRSSASGARDLFVATRPSVGEPFGRAELLEELSSAAGATSTSTRSATDG